MHFICFNKYVINAIALLPTNISSTIGIIKLLKKLLFSKLYYMNNNVDNESETSLFSESSNSVDHCLQVQDEMINALK